MNNFFVLVTENDMVVHARVEKETVLGLTLLEKTDLPIRKDIFFNDVGTARNHLVAAMIHTSKYFSGTELHKEVYSAKIVRYHLNIIEIQ